jgi:hypothetical protein
MALQNSGQIAFSDINVELGNNSTTQLSLGGSSARDLAGVSSGQISMSNFYGASASSTVYVYFNEMRYGSNVGYIDIFLTNASGNLITNSIYQSSGDNGQTWYQRNTQAAVVEEDFRILWFYQSLSGFRGDYAIDEVNVYLNDSVYTIFNFNSSNQGFITSSTRYTTPTRAVDVVSTGTPVPTTTSSSTSRWNRHNGSTPSSSTGPTSGSDGSYYLYAETTSPNNGGQYFFLLSPVISLP